MPDPVPSFELIQFNPLVQRKSPLKGQRRRKPRSHHRRRQEHGDQRHRQNSGGQRRHSWLLLFVSLFQTLSPSPLSPSDIISEDGEKEATTQRIWKQDGGEFSGFVEKERERRLVNGLRENLYYLLL